MINRRIELQTCKKKLLVMFEFREQGEPDPHTIGFTTAVAGSPMEESDWSAVLDEKLLIAVCYKDLLRD